MSSAARRFGRVATLYGVGALCTVACTLDSRYLAQQSADTSDAQAESGPPADMGPPVRFVDSGQVDYSEAGRPPPMPSSSMPQEMDAGPCMHTDTHGLPDCSQTLIVNADFNRTIDGWDAAQGAVLRWVNLDSQQAKASGSLAVKNGLLGDLDGTIAVAATQCLDADPQSIYTYASNMFIQKGQPYGLGIIIVYFYTQAGCQGLVSSATTVAGTDATGVWMLAAGDLTTPANVKSQSVRLNVQKAYRVDPIEILFDAVRVTKVNDAPVTAP
jgi:hypothetical protein